MRKVYCVDVECSRCNKTTRVDVTNAVRDILISDEDYKQIIEYIDAGTRTYDFKKITEDLKDA